MCPGIWNEGKAPSSSLSALQDYIGDRELVAIACRILFSTDLDPVVGKWRFPVYIAFGAPVHARQINPVRVWESRFEQLGSRR